MACSFKNCKQVGKFVHQFQDLQRLQAHNEFPPSAPGAGPA